MIKKRVQNNLVKKSNLKKVLKVLLFFILLIITILLVLFFINLQKQKEKKIAVSDLEIDWQNKEYTLVYDKANILLDDNQYASNYNFYKGISAFYLALEQIELPEAQNYINDAIFSFRIAIHGAKKKDLPTLYYLLAKSYFQKNSYSSSFFYADLAVLYFQKALDSGYSSNDIPEYLGLSYALLNETEESIKAFSQALAIRESDVLLLAIAKQYFEIENYAIAKQYLHLAENKTQNQQIILEANLLLANILYLEERFDEAFDIYTDIISIDEDNAEAYYGLGLIYEAKGDMVRARAQWRRVINLQINHLGAIQKLSL